MLIHSKGFGSGEEKFEKIVSAINTYKPKQIGMVGFDFVSLWKSGLNEFFYGKLKYRKMAKPNLPILVPR